MATLKLNIDLRPAGVHPVAQGNQTVVDQNADNGDYNHNDNYYNESAQFDSWSASSPIVAERLRL